MSRKRGFLPPARVRFVSTSRRSASTAPSRCGRNDAYIEPVKFPAGLGYEAAGIVDAVGKDVTGFAAGDEVNLVPSFSMNQYFTYGEVILAPDYAVVKHPKSLSFPA